MQIEVISAFTTELEKIWCNFEKEALGTPFQSYAWLSHWHNTTGYPLLSVKPQVVLVKENEKLMTIFPFGIRKSMGILILEWLGGGQTDYMGPLLSEKWESSKIEFLNCWQNVIKKLDPFDVIHFQKQKKHFGVLWNPFVEFLSCKKHELTYQVNLNSSWEEHYKKTVKSKLRADSRRQRSRLSNIGKLTFVVADDKVAKKQIICKMIQQKSHQYLKKGLWDMFSFSEYKTFYEKLSNIPNDYLIIHVSKLSVGETIIASHVGIIDKKIFYYLMPAYEEENWGKYSPGRLLLEHLIEWSIQNKLKVFDFTTGDELYKKDWCDTKNKLFEKLEAITTKGEFYTIAQKTKHSIKQIPWLSSQGTKINVWLKNNTSFSGRSQNPHKNLH